MKSFERRIQVAKAMKKELAAIIQGGGIKDDRVNGFVSIVEVDLNPSLSSAKVIYSVLSENPEEHEINNMSAKAALNDAAKHLRGRVARRLNLKFAPKIYFVPSDSLTASVDLVHLIDQTVEEDEAAHQEALDD